MGTVVPPHTFIQGSGQVPGPAAHARGLLSALQCGDSPGPELPGVIIYSFSNKSCPSLCRLCTPVLWAPSFIREAPRYGEVSASDGQRALRTCPADKCNHRTDPRALQACSLPPRSPQASGAQSRPPPPPPALVGRRVATITCYYDFLGNIYIFTITRPLSFIFHENWHEINDRATEETARHATLIY